MTLAPVALFVYRRLEHTVAAVEALLRNSEARDTDLVVFSDAARDASAANQVAQVRSYARGISGFQSVRVVERESNLGLAGSIIDGVSALCRQFGRAIVVEDDLVLSTRFLHFMNGALARYEANPNVMQVCGYMFPVRRPEKLPPVFFTTLPTSWGWGTWARAWSAMQLDAAYLLAQLEARNALYEFDVLGSYGYSDMLRLQASGQLDSWAIRWYATMFLADGLCVRPARSLVRNNGFDGTGVHCGRTDVFDVTVSEQAVDRFPDAVAESKAAVQAIAEYYRSLAVTPLRRGLRKVGRLFGL